MDRRTAFGIFRLNPNADMNDIKTRRNELIKEAIDKGDAFMRETYQEAYKVIKDTDGQAVGSVENFITHDGFEKPPEKIIHRIPPYDEAEIKERIAALPRRVGIFCIVTNQKISCELVFHPERNRISLKNPIPYKNEPMVNEITRPVMESDIERTADTATSSEAVETYFKQRSIDENVAKLAELYSTPTRSIYPFFSNNGIGELVKNDPQVGHNHSCHICGADSYYPCRHCEGVVCANLETWPNAWSDLTSSSTEYKIVPCPYCAAEMRFRHPKRKRKAYTPPPETEDAKPFKWPVRQRIIKNLLGDNEKPSLIGRLRGQKLIEKK
ncbi:MAG TPA: hypothetical protein DIT67_02635 [Octadecabacter sp.]|nr:hypothetical protein [Octadecabacter sp.]